MREKLICHPSVYPRSVRSIYVDIDYFIEDRRTIHFNVRYQVQCDPAKVRLPSLGSGLVAPEPADGLWRTTCFELFWGSRIHREYYEHNFAPDGHWASYRFSDYRTGMRTEEQAPRRLETTLTDDGFTVEVAAPFIPMDGPQSRLGLSAVIEEVDGTKSYWALNHPAGSPDFHHRDCFALMLGAPDLA